MEFDQHDAYQRLLAIMQGKRQVRLTGVDQLIEQMLRLLAQRPLNHQLLRVIGASKTGSTLQPAISLVQIHHRAATANNIHQPRQYRFEHIVQPRFLAEAQGNRLKLINRPGHVADHLIQIADFPDRRLDTRRVAEIVITQCLKLVGQCLERLPQALT